MQQWGQENGSAMTFDEASMERSKSFVKALQELKNLRPQLYSAAEYCEKSYLHSEQKQMVLDNLKDYAVRALVNAVDHLGTVAYKLTDLFEQQTVDMSTVELKITCLNQQIMTCRTYTDKEGLKQQLMSGTTARHHKHYTLPNSVHKGVESSSRVEGDSFANVLAKYHDHTTGVPASKTLSWHLATEKNPSPNETPDPKLGSVKNSKFSKVTSDVFHLLEAEEPGMPEPLSTHLRTTNQRPTFDFVSHAPGIKGKMEVTKPLSTFKSLDNPGRLEIYRPPVRTKTMLSTFFAKNKSFKPKRVPVS